MMVQILKEYSQRTEYKVLQKYTDIQETSIENITQGVFLLPGILLGKLEKAEIDILKGWMNIPDNQLIITPALMECNIKDFLDTSLDLIIVKQEGLDYEGIECEYKIESKVQEKIFKNEKGDFGIHYRKDTGSGLLTIITLPLLDYKLSHKHSEFRQYFDVCINIIRLKKKTKEAKKKQFEIKEEHLQVIMLIAAGFELEKDLARGFSQYFNSTFDLKTIQKLEKEGFIKDNRLTYEGIELVKQRRLKSFIKVLEGGRGADEW